ncbi:MAG TPA: hypothetical protein V6C98_18385 [Thermosynechococcaceae cyanobacterium]
MQTLSATMQPPSSQAVLSDSQPVYTYLGWEIFLNRVFQGPIDKGLWLHWYHPADRRYAAQEGQVAVRYGYFVAPTQPLEEALYAAQQSIDAIIELESMQTDRPFIVQNEFSERHWQDLPLAS